MSARAAVAKFTIGLRRDMPEGAALFAAIPIACVMVDARDRFRAANPAGEQFLSLSVPQLRHLAIGDLIPMDSPIFAMLAQVRDRGVTIQERDLNFDSPRLSRRGVTVQAAPFGEEPGCVVLTFSDGAAARALDRQLSFRNAARSVAGMAAILAHEVRNPLSGIRGAAQLLENTVVETDRELAVLIREEADRIRALVDRMEAFGEGPLERGAVNIHRVLGHVRKLAQSGFAAHLRVVERYDPSLPPVWGHRDQLVQVFLNLVKNAAEAMTQAGREGEITLITAYQHSIRLAAPSATGSGGGVHLPLMVIVRDQGPGIPPEIEKNLFDPFVTTKMSGSGLGLALVAKIVGDHGGLIEVDSRPERTEFRISLPLFPEARDGGAVGRGLMSSPPTVLVADDDRSIRTVLTQALGRSGYQVRATGHAQTLWRWVEEGEGDLVITDVMMPDDNGLEMLPRIRRVRPELRVVVMSAQSTLLTAVKAAQRGAFEYLPKPFDLKELLTVVERALAAPLVVADVAAEARDGEEKLPLIGRSQAMQEIYRTIARLTTTDLTVMVNGESGTGKELVARALHDYGRRRSGPFVAINMAAIPRELIESELFGHERGSFTGAHSRSLGRFEQAAGGTLFLDEIGDMPGEAQTRLLRVLQEGEFTSVGGRTPIRANVRIVAATHRDLRQSIRAGLFREDLYYRLCVVPIRLPPLRERAEDIALLARHFLDRARDAGLPFKTLDGGAIEALGRHRWPGNVRELENVMRRLAALTPQETITAEVIEAELAEPAMDAAQNGGGRAPDGLAASVERHLKQMLAGSADGIPTRDIYDQVLAEVERPLIRMTLSATRGNQIKAAAMLGLNRNTLRKKIRDLGIPVVRGIG